MIRSPWRPHFSQSICSPGRTCLFCLSCSQGYVPWLDKKSCWWLIISLSMMAIELITSNSLFCLARNIKLFWLFSKYSPIPQNWLVNTLTQKWRFECAAPSTMLCPCPCLDLKVTLTQWIKKTGMRKLSCETHVSWVVLDIHNWKWMEMKYKVLKNWHGHESHLRDNFFYLLH